MKLLGKCVVCKKNGFLLRKRKYTIKVVGEITSKNPMCGTCYKNIKIKVKDQLI